MPQFTTPVTTSHQEWESQIVQRFFRLARSWARKQLAPSLVRRIAPTDIANTSLYLILKRARDQRCQFDDESFKRQLACIVRRRLSSAVRKAKAGKRNIELEIPSDCNMIASPIVLPDCDHLVMEYAERIQKWIETISDPTEKLLAQLSILERLEARVIESILNDQIQEDPSRGLRLLKRRQIQKITKRLRHELLWELSPST